MAKKFSGYYFEVWYSDGKTYWSYDLHEMFNHIRCRRLFNDRLSCLVQMRAEFSNSVVKPIVTMHELKFGEVR